MTQSETLRNLARQRIRSKNPELDEAGVTAELVRELYGIERSA